MNFTDLAITVSAKHEPHHTRVTSNCHRYYGIMKHYQVFFEMHINTRSHQRRQWFSCTLRHLLRRRRHCRRNFRLANALSLLLLLGGDVELNPGPRQDEMHHDTSMSIPGPNVISVAELNETERQGIKETEAKKQARLGMLSACQKKRLEAETVEQHDARLVRLSQNQSMRLQCETEEQRAARLTRLSDNQKKHLESESP